MNELGPWDPTANNFFLLAISIDSGQNLVVDFQRDGVSAPIPTNRAHCNFQITKVMAERGGFEPPVEVLAPTTV